MNHNPCIIFANEQSQYSNLLSSIDFGYIKVLSDYQDPSVHVKVIKPTNINIVEEIHWLASMMQQTPVYMVIFDKCFGQSAKQSLVKMMLSQKGTIYIISIKHPVLIEYVKYKNLSIMNAKAKECAATFVNLVVEPANIKKLIKCQTIDELKTYCDIYTNKIIMPEEKFWITYQARD